MKRPFAITVAATELALDHRGHGRLAITVSNTRERPVTARAAVIDEGAAAGDHWLHLDETQTFALAALASRQLVLTAAADPRIPAGVHRCHIAVWDEDAPDEDYVDGPAIALTVRPWPAARRRGFPWIPVLIATLAITALAGPWAWATMVTQGWLHRVRVPNVTGLDVATAEPLLAPGLRLGTVAEVAVSPRPLGCIVDQDPAPGTVVPAGSAVSVTVHGGILVPDLAGQIPGRAQQVLAANRLVLGRQDTVVEASQQPLGSILRQAPAKGAAVAAGSPVDVVVLAGVTVPDLRSTTLEFAQAACTALGLVSQVAPGQLQRRDGLAKPTVIAQDPAPGQQRIAGSVVTITVVYPQDVASGGTAP